MSKIGTDVLAEFYARLEEAGEVDDAMVEGLKEVLGAAKKLKADDLVTVFQQEEELEVP